MKISTSESSEASLTFDLWNVWPFVFGHRVGLRVTAVEAAYQRHIFRLVLWPQMRVLRNFVHAAGGCIDNQISITIGDKDWDALPLTPHWTQVVR